MPIGSPDEKKHKVSGEVLKASVSSAVSQMKEMKKNTLSSVGHCASTRVATSTSSTPSPNVSHCLQFLGVQTSVRAIVSEDKVADEFKTTLRQDFMAAVTAYTKSEVPSAVPLFPFRASDTCYPRVDPILFDLPQLIPIHPLSFSGHAAITVAGDGPAIEGRQYD